MEINLLYEKILKDLKEGRRPLYNLKNEEVLEIERKWNDLLEDSKVEEGDLRKILCIVGNIQNFSKGMTQLILKTLSKNLSPDCLIFALACAQKHIITKSMIEGIVPPSEFILILKKLLEVSDPESFLWVLRTIELLEGQSIRLKDEILRHKPPFFKLFNPYLRESKKIVDNLEKRWGM
jgi:hypothetical protein